MIKWLKAANQNAKLRASLIVAARNLMADMDPNWRQGAGKSSDAVAVLLMRIGLAHIEAVYQGQMAAQSMISRAEARLNQTAAHLN